MATLTNASTYTTATEVINADYIVREVMESLRESAMALEFSTVVDIGPLPTRTAAFPKSNSFSATLKTSDDLVTASTAWNPTEATATAAEYSAMSYVTDMLRRSSAVDVEGAVAQEIAAALGEQMETSFCALSSGFTGGGISTTGVNITADGMLETLKDLKVLAKARAGKKPAFILHPQQIYDLMGEGTSKTNGLGTAFARHDIVGLYQNGALESYVGHFANVPVFSNGLIPTSSSAADRDGMLICEGAIGCALKWLTEIETQRTAVDGVNATVYLGTIAYAFVEVNDSLGCSLVTDA